MISPPLSISEGTRSTRDIGTRQAQPAAAVGDGLEGASLLVTFEDLRGHLGLPPGVFSVGRFAEWYDITKAGAMAVLNRAERARIVVRVRRGASDCWRKA